MASPSVIERLKRSRVVQALIVYLGASWIVLEVTTALQDGLGLPPWVTPVALVLLLVGLVVVLATAWVQSSPLVDEREAAGELPETWEVGVGDLLAALRRGRMPHLTWGRALLGGLFAFWLLFGFAGLYVLLREGDAPVSVAPLTAEEAGAGLAVVPWSVSGADEEVYREGMITLLGTTLDGVAGLRAVDSRTVLARWDEVVGENRRPDLAAVLQVARRAGARYTLVGTAVSTGPDVRLVGDLYDVETGEKLGTAQAEGQSDSLMAMVDRFAVETTRVLLSGRDGETAPQHLESLTTPSMDALLAYVEGESAYRRASWNTALEAYERAIDHDSTFALAHLRASQVLGWAEVADRSAQRAEHLAAAARFGERLPARERALLSALQGVDDHDVDAIDAAEDAVRRYPDDPDLWNALGELYYHVGQKALATTEQEKEPLQRAADLLPDFVPYLIHLTEYELSYGDSATAADLVRREEELVTDTSVPFPRLHRVAFNVVYGDAAARREALSSLDSPEGYVWSATRGVRRLEAQEAIGWSLWERDRQDVNAQTYFATVLVNRGRIDRALEVLPSSVWQGDRLRTILCHYGLIPADSLRNTDWELPAPGAFGKAFTALVLNDTATAAAAMAAYESEPYSAFYNNFLDGLWLWDTEGPAAAESTLVASYDANSGDDIFVAPYLQWLLGDLYEQLGDERQAFEYFRAAARVQPLAALQAARLADRLGETDEARRLYQDVLIAWKDADPQFEPWLEEARRWSEPVPG